ncbi:hypothetical protein [Halothiobacillus sp.]|uniref:lipopolysaccharide biosynthesis protein n=1 Tax=Halothiobacillus sp. TaxID=1891311 RepID=UPI002AD218FF|nr:hypothetical protein [Halothiobacillus sp.]
MTNKHHHLHDIVVLGVGRVLQALIMVGTVRVMTEVLPASELGRYYLFLAVYTFFGLVFINPVGQYINRKTNYWDKTGQLHQRLYDYSYFVLLVSGVSSLVLFGATTMGITTALSGWVFLVVMPLFVFFNTWANTLLPLLNMLLFRKTFVALTVLMAMSILVVPYLSTRADPTAANWLLGMSVGYGMMAFVGLAFFTRLRKLSRPWQRNPLHYEMRLWWRFGSFVVPLALATVFMWFQASGFRIMIESFFSLEYLAYLGVGLTLATQMGSALEGLVSQFYHPLYYRAIEGVGQAERAAALEDAAFMVAPVYTIFFFSVAAFADEFFRVLVASEFQSAYNFLIIGMVFEYFRMMTNLYANASHSEMKTLRLVFPYVLGAFVAVFAVIFGWVIGDHYYITPVIWAAGMLVTFGATFISAKNLLGVSLPTIPIIRGFIWSVPILVASWLLDDRISSIYGVLGVLFVLGVYGLFAVFLCTRVGINARNHSSA